MRLCLVVGARPNFMKVAPIIRELKKYPDIEYVLVHTGQHYSSNMSDIFFKDLDIPKPDVNLGVMSSNVMIVDLINNIFMLRKPDIVVVFGDVDSTLYTAIAASKSGYKLAHVEAGMRSFDRSMPEELNRIVIDVLSDFLFTATEYDTNNLLREGIDISRIFQVGDIMIDNLLYNLPLVRNILVPEKNYVLVTIHRQSNTDIKENLKMLLFTLDELSKKVNIIFPLHPRTKKMVKQFKLEKFLRNIDIVEPMSYLQFLAFMMKAKIVITDSGGIQVETTALNIPCITLRYNTERSYTVESGTNVLVGNNLEKILSESFNILSGNQKVPLVNGGQWFDGRAAERIIEILYESTKKGY